MILSLRRKFRIYAHSSINDNRNKPGDIVGETGDYYSERFSKRVGKTVRFSPPFYLPLVFPTSFL